MALTVTISEDERRDHAAAESARRTDWIDAWTGYNSRMERLERINELLPAGPPLREGSAGWSRRGDRPGRGPPARGRGARDDGGTTPGKTSVAVAALERVQATGGRVAAVTLTELAHDRAVAQVVAGQLASAPRRAGRSILSILRAIDRSPARGLAGPVLDDLAAGGALADAALAQSDDLAQVIGVAGRQGSAAILLDEAHAMLDWPPSTLTALNAVLRKQVSAGVIIASSDTEALERLTGRGGPLYLVGSRVGLPAIQLAEWIAALSERFAALDVEVSLATLEALVDITGAHPYLTMRLARDTARIATDHAPPWHATPAVREAAFYELKRDPVWTALHESPEG